MVDAGCSAKILKCANYSWEELKAASCSAKSLVNAGCSVKDLKVPVTAARN